MSKYCVVIKVETPCDEEQPVLYEVYGPFNKEEKAIKVGEEKTLELNESDFGRLCVFDYEVLKIKK